MKVRKSYFLLLVVAVALLTTSCRKGCIVPFADNYNPKAKDSDGSCIYSADHVIYFDYDVSRALLNHGIEVIVVKTQNTAHYVVHNVTDWAPEADVNNPRCIVLKETLMRQPTKSDYVTITDVQGHILWDFSIKFSAGFTETTELLWTADKSVAQTNY